jgi:hypothetical protein
MFWTKLGTTTGVAASGTVEEIDASSQQASPRCCIFPGGKLRKTRSTLSKSQN